MRSKILSEEISEKITEMILNGNLQPGQQIDNEQELIKNFNVSRTTIREAIKSLVSKNILEIKRGKGTFVCSIPGMAEDPFGLLFMDEEEKLEHLWEVRKVFEPYCGMLAAERGDEKEIKMLGKIVKKIDELHKKIEVDIPPQELIDELSCKDVKFHNLICQMSKNPLFDRFIPIVNKAVLMNYTNTIFRKKLHRSVHISTHGHIYEAIKARDKEKAFKLCKQHIENGGKLLMGKEINDKKNIAL